MATKYIVPDEILGKAINCSHSNLCLETGCCGNRKMCSAANSNGVVILETLEPAECVYRKEIAFRIQVCKCPVRLFLFKELGV